jgi:hypothetical protein
MEGWQTALLVIGALLVGALLPAIVQLRLSLRALGAATERISAQAGEALEAVTATPRRLDRLTARLEEGQRVEGLLAGIDSLSRTVVQLQETVRVASAVGAAVGPAIGAAVRAWRATRPDDDAAPERAGDGAVVQDTQEGKEGRP